MPSKNITTRGGTAVMQNRRSTQASLDLFPTPPWATRALFPYIHAGEVAWEPAAGLGHMAEVLAERFNIVHASDVHDHGYLSDLSFWHGIGSFVGEGLDVLAQPSVVDWVITNPPFKLAEEFAHRALSIATVGVALLVRIAWLEGGERYRNLFAVRPPQTIAVFCERVPLVQGRWDPEAASATCYAWVIWRQPLGFPGPTVFTWIEPGRRAALTQPDDVRRFARGA